MYNKHFYDLTIKRDMKVTSNTMGVKAPKIM